MSNITVIPGKQDGDVDTDLPEFVYLHLIVMVKGEQDGTISGYFLPSVADHIRKALSVGEQR